MVQRRRKCYIPINIITRNQTSTWMMPHYIYMYPTVSCWNYQTPSLDIFMKWDTVILGSPTVRAFFLMLVIFDDCALWHCHWCQVVELQRDRILNNYIANFDPVRLKIQHRHVLDNGRPCEYFSLVQDIFNV